MKITKTEKIWLAVIVILFALYNIPGFPPYGSIKGCLLTGLVLVGGIWVFSYLGMIKVYKAQKLREEAEMEEHSSHQEQGIQKEKKEDKTC